jgi:ubiquinone/menaquinone biosynthesis C-methylase UbiE
MPHHRRKKGTRSRAPTAPTSWEHVASWYLGWAGRGSRHHRAVAIPVVLELLELRPGEHLLDIGSGAGTLARAVARAGAHYVGVDVSTTMLRHARRHHGECGRFLRADARRLSDSPEVAPASADAVSFVFSIQDMNPLDDVIRSAAWALRPGGRLVIFMTHPCFRVPRQSGWEWDERRRLHFRRVDRYLGHFSVPMHPPGARVIGRALATRSFHRPLEAYVSALAAHGISIDRLRELPPPAEASDRPGAPRATKEPSGNSDIPAFVAMRGRKEGA